MSRYVPALVPLAFVAGCALTGSVPLRGLACLLLLALAAACHVAPLPGSRAQNGGRTALRPGAPRMGAHPVRP